MKTQFALGLILLSLLAVLCHRRGTTESVPNANRQLSGAVQASIAVVEPANQRPISGQTSPVETVQEDNRTVARSPQPGTDSLADIESLSDPDQKSEAIDRAADSLPARDIPAMVNSLAQEFSLEAADLRKLLIGRWAESDPSVAGAYAIQLREPSAQRSGIEQVTIAWANADPAAASEWVDRLPEGETKDAAGRSIAYEAARSDPVGSLKSAVTLQPGPARDDLICFIVAQWANVDSRTAAGWAMQVNDENLRERLLATVSVAEAPGDGLAAATLVAQTMRQGEEQNRAAVAVAQRWAQKSPDEAVSWVEKFNDASLRAATAQSLASILRQQNSLPIN